VDPVDRTPPGRLCARPAAGHGGEVILEVKSENHSVTEGRGWW
jgi:hypothetical protein